MPFYLKRKEFLQARNNYLVQIAGDKSNSSSFATPTFINRYSIIASPSLIPTVCSAQIELTPCITYLMSVKESITRDFRL
jgi:hypothetical protein